jgi:hypothetical protein
MQFATKKCVACGGEVQIPYVGVKNPRPSKKLALCDRPACIKARGERLAIVQTQNMREASGSSGLTEFTPGGSGACVQTPEGTIFVEEERDQEHVAADQAMKQEELKNKKHRRKKIAPPAPPPTTGLPRQPAYIKSVALPAVPTNNPDAPFGRDDNGRPLVPIRMVWTS